MEKMDKTKTTPKYAAEKDGFSCARCGRSKNSHNKQMECLPKDLWFKL